MRVMVTGSEGFVGKHLIEVLKARGHYICACTKDSLNVSDSEEIIYRKMNFEDSVDIENLINGFLPEAIIHLAAQSSVKDSWDNPTETLNINILGTTKLVDAAVKKCKSIKLVYVGSSEEYGITGKIERPITEEDGCFPQNPYAISKFAAGQIVLQLATRNSNITAYHIRAFNHYGPGQKVGFVVSDFASQIAKIEKGKQPPIIKVGDLSAQRDFTDVRDIVLLYADLLESEVPSGTFNVCSGKTVSIQYILDLLLSFSNEKIDVVVDKNLYRPVEIPIFQGSNTKITEVFKWRPTRDLNASLQETLDWWRSII